MKLHWSPRSPFVRKVMIVLHETALIDRVECVRSVVAFMAAPNEDVLRDNPLGKIPALVLDDGRTLFDSRVICEYLDGLEGSSALFPADPGERVRQLRWMALGDGLTEILLLWRNELLRPAGAYDVLTSAFARKVRVCMERLDAEAPELGAAPFGIGHIAIVCAVGQLDFRFRDSHWREAFPALAEWFGRVGRRDSIVATMPRDDPSLVPVPRGFDETSPIDFRSFPSAPPRNTT
ncbi:glutathione S-transferase family protein [Microbaculum marinum]|uniref:Glutathione S-transferase N-terminal domain-containing protein n=1 Tax=Microbaculum marinum TaxID=1764581 RepID=A0AAW9RHT3_9HYPH